MNKNTLKDNFYKLLNKDIKELNGVILSLACIVFLLVVGLISYKFSNTYALFGNDIIGIKTINIEVAKPSAADTLISKVGTGGLEKITHPADSTLQIGATSDLTEYRYRGANPNNYVTFNNETWRIIGVFPTDDGTGKIENRVKLVRNETLSNFVDWDNNNGLSGLVNNNKDVAMNNLIINDDVSSNVIKLAPDGGTLNYGENNWANATLNTYLNGNYYNTLTSDAQNMVENAKYYLGGYRTDAIGKNEIYQYERKISGSDYYYGTNPNNDVNKIALMYASDYGYAASDECARLLNDYSDSSCISNNWLYNADFADWLLMPASSNSIAVFVRWSYGYITYVAFTSSNRFAVRPVVYLTSDTKINDGDGTADNPYTLI